jgi:signal transduction histidine kinase
LERLSGLHSELLTLTRELAKGRAEFERMNAFKNQILGMAAHDLRGPLGAIKALGEVLLQAPGTALPCESRETVAFILDAARRMRGLVDDLLDFSRIEAGTLRLEFRDLNLEELLRENMAVSCILAQGRKVEIGLDLPSETGRLWVEGDPLRLGQVLSNLLDNAMKVSPPGGRVLLRLRTEDGRAVIAVQDQGPGIPPGDRERVFEPFERGNAAERQGAGLGLAIVRKVVAAHGGRVWFECGPEGGCTFFVSLPLRAAPAADGPPGSRPDPVGPPRGASPDPPGGARERGALSGLGADICALRAGGWTRRHLGKASIRAGRPRGCRMRLSTLEGSPHPDSVAGILHGPSRSGGRR